ncbi:MAG: ABC transporter ATP-binding protein [Acetobacteraceae bacterium]
MAPGPLLEVIGLSKWYDLGGRTFSRAGSYLKAVNDVSFSLAPREVLGIAGESGSGKTTIGRAVLRLIMPTAGIIRFLGEDITRCRRARLRRFRRHAQIVFQDPFASLDPKMTIERIVAEPLQAQGLLRSRRSRRDQAAALLETVALGSEYLDRRPHEISGGQRQRVGIARALSVGPELLVADEPTSALDVSIQAQIINLLEDMKERFGLGMLFISHDIAVMGHLADRIAVVYLGRIMEIGPKRALLNQTRHPYTEALLSAVPEPGSRRLERVVLTGDAPNAVDPPVGCLFRGRCRYAVAECGRELPELRAVGPDHYTACIRDDIFDTPRNAKGAAVVARAAPHRAAPHGAVNVPGLRATEVK